MIKSPSAFVESIVFSDGKKIRFEQEDKIIVVGANNCGKSQLLRDIFSVGIHSNQKTTLSTKEIIFIKIGSIDQLDQYIIDNSKFIDGQYQYRDFIGYPGISQTWNAQNFMQTYHKLFMKFVTTEQRLSICIPQASVSAAAMLVNPQHVMFFDNGVFDRVNSLFKEAFDKELMFDRQGGATMRLHVGRRPETYADQMYSPKCNRDVIQFPTLDQQGDGIKGYLGIIFETIVSNYSINLIDEPESFLHPPQMRRLGETLAREVKAQLFVSTHSSDILRGFLVGTKGSLRILRINRIENINYVTEIPQAELSELWANPVLRYSNALEGIFHEQTIICEDDSDCRLINSMADHLESRSPNKWRDTAYVPAGGKHAIPKIAELLRAVGVPVKAVFDIDFLSERELVKKTISAFGGDWQKIETQWIKVDAAIREKKKPKSHDEIKGEISDLIEHIPAGEKLPRGKIVEILKQDSAWGIIKNVGESGLPKGDIRTTFATLINNLESIGIYVIKAGEIENFCPSVGGHGPNFVNSLLSETPLDDPKLADLSAFVSLVHQSSISFPDAPNPAEISALEHDGTK